jgi:hypothetical protein
MENETRDHDLRRQLVTIFFGALIGFVPTIFVTLYQSHLQKSQLLLDRKMSALRDFSAAVGGGGELMSAVAELDVAIYHLGHLEPRARTAADWQRVDSLYKLVIDRRYKWASDVNTQAAMIVALFPPAARMSNEWHDSQLFKVCERPTAPSRS